jgi:hypothetical protein
MEREQQPLSYLPPMTERERHVSQETLKLRQRTLVTITYEPRSYQLFAAQVSDQVAAVARLLSLTVRQNNQHTASRLNRILRIRCHASTEFAESRNIPVNRDAKWIEKFVRAREEANKFVTDWLGNANLKRIVTAEFCLPAQQDLGTSDQGIRLATDQVRSALDWLSEKVLDQRHQLDRAITNILEPCALRQYSSM